MTAMPNFYYAIFAIFEFVRSKSNKYPNFSLEKA